MTAVSESEEPELKRHIVGVHLKIARVLVTLYIPSIGQAWGNLGAIPLRMFAFNGSILLSSSFRFLAISELKSLHKEFF